MTDIIFSILNRRGKPEEFRNKRQGAKTVPRRKIFIDTGKCPGKEKARDKPAANIHSQFIISQNFAKYSIFLAFFPEKFLENPMFNQLKH